MDEYLYVPSLKGKRGERLALKELADPVKNNIKPIINVINVDDTSKFYNGNAFVDLHKNLHKNKNDNELESIFSNIYGQTSIKSRFTSVLKYGYSDNLLSRIKPYIFNLEKGVAIRIPRSSLSNLQTYIDSVTNVFGIDSKLIDVIIDFEGINDMALSLAQEFSSNIKNALSKMNISKVIILASAFPVSLNVPSDAISELRRYDFLLFTALRKSIPQVIFGDYGSDDPLDPKIENGMNIVPTIRYTYDDCWKIVRGHYDSAMPYDFSQFYDLSKRLSGSNFYKGRSYSWGDDVIFKCANAACTNGNLETWVRVAMNHHITFVVNEHARLLSS